MNLLIVDDEHHIVNYLELLVTDAIKEDLEIYKAYSGHEALEILKDTKIDLILLDIKMPGMTGLELARKVTQTWSHCRIIFLTAYDSFHYIYETKEYPNTVYLLKTEPDHIIISTIYQAIDSIKQEQEQKTILDNTISKNKYLSYLLQQHLLRMLLTGISMEALHAEYRMLQSECSLDLEKPFYLMYMKIRHRNLSESQNPEHTHILQYMNLAEYQLSNKFNFAILRLDNGDFLWFFQQKDEADFGLSSSETFLNKIANNLAADFSNTFHRKTLLFLYPDTISCPDVYRIFHLFQKQLDKYDYAADMYSSVILCQNEAETSQAASDFMESIEKKLASLTFCLSHGKENDFFSLLTELKISCAASQSMHNLSSIRIYNSIALTLLNYIDTYQIQESIASRTAIYHLYYIHDFSDWQTAFQYLKTCAQHIFKIMSQKSSNRKDQIIEKIRNYILNNLDKSLNLSNISATVNYNETYVSRLFREHTGIKLSDFILQERISKAKQLLTTTNLSINYIASETGFDSIHYFSYAFKKAVGMNPSDYRRTIL